VLYKRFEKKTIKSKIGGLFGLCDSCRVSTNAILFRLIIGMSVYAAVYIYIYIQGV